MTRKQKDLMSRSLRLLAGKLYVRMYNRELSEQVRGEIRVAHNATCRAFNLLEDEE